MNAAKPQFSDLKVQSDPRVDDNGPLAQFKVQCGFAAVQSSKFNAPPPQFKVQGKSGSAAVQVSSFKSQPSAFSLRPLILP